MREYEESFVTIREPPQLACEQGVNHFFLFQSVREYEESFVTIRKPPQLACEQGVKRLLIEQCERI